MRWGCNLLSLAVERDADGLDDVVTVVTRVYGDSLASARLADRRLPGVRGCEDTDAMSSAAARNNAMRQLMPVITEPYAPASSDAAPLGIAKSPRSSLPTLLVTKDRKKIGAYLIDHQVLIMVREEDRSAAAQALAEAGFTVKDPLAPAESGEQLLRLRVTAIGSWGNVLLFEVDLQQHRVDFRVAVYDLETKVLCSVARDLNPGITRLLALTGLEVESTNWIDTPAVLRKKLALEVVDWGYERAVPDLASAASRSVGDKVVRTLTPSAAARVPPEIATAVNKLFATPVKDPFTDETIVKPGDIPRGFWSHQHGVLDQWELSRLRELSDLQGVILPADWRTHWEGAQNLSRSHALSLTALSLHDAHPDWWATLPSEPAREYLHGIWLLGHSDKMPGWMRADETRTEEHRFGAAVAAIIAAVGELDWLEPASVVPQDCALCGRSFKPSMLAAGHVAQLRTAQVCHLCVRFGFETLPLSSSPELEAGSIVAVREIVRLAGRVISASMIPDLLFEGSVDPVTMILLRHILPDGSGGSWATWLARAGVLGEGWRPSRGYISIAADGHHCRSLFERIVDDFLSANDIGHEVEPPYPFDAELNPHGARADWRLADGRYVEAAGLMSKADYVAKMTRKAELASKYGISLVVLTEADLPKLRSLIG